MSEIVAVDIGGTHARFAMAEIEDGRVVSLGEACILRTSEHTSLQTAWEEFGARLDRPLPSAAGIAIAGPVHGDLLKMTNCPWIIRPDSIPQTLDLDRFRLVNDFGAIGHAVAQLDARWFRHVCGPDVSLPDEGVISIVGPGTGLGIGLLLRRAGHSHVVETEGGHGDFAPLDSLEDKILAMLRSRYRRVSVERIASGPGLANLYESLAAIEHRPASGYDQKQLWAAALAGEDSLAAAALDRFCLSFGAIAGDIALSQGASAVVLAGGVGLRLADHLPKSGFGERFIAKGRFERHMEGLPVRLITYPDAGLFGAAVAFAQAYGD